MSRCSWDDGIILPATLLGIAAEPVTDDFGSAHICLQPLMLIGRTCLAVGLIELGRRMRLAFVWSLVIDVLLGIVLQFRMEMLAIHLPASGIAAALRPPDGMLNTQAMLNAQGRFVFGLTFLGRSLVCRSPATIPLAALAIALCGLAIVYIANNAFTIVGSPARSRQGLVSTIAVIYNRRLRLVCFDGSTGRIYGNARAHSPGDGRGGIIGLNGAE